MGWAGGAHAPVMVSTAFCGECVHTACVPSTAQAGASVPDTSSAAHNDAPIRHGSSFKPVVLGCSTAVPDACSLVCLFLPSSSSPPVHLPPSALLNHEPISEETPRCFGAAPGGSGVGARTPAAAGPAGPDLATGCETERLRSLHGEAPCKGRRARGGEGSGRKRLRCCWGW